MKELHFFNPKALFLVGTTSAVMTVVSGCGNPADNKPEAQVAPAVEVEPAPAKPDMMAMKTYVFSPESTIGFIGSKVTGSHEGGFKKFSGSLTTINGSLSPRNSKIVIDMDSTWSDSDRLTGHLKNADFFEVEKYPESVFEATEVSGTAPDLTIKGNLTLHGITKNISFPATVTVTEEAVTLKAEFSINRFDFNIEYKGKADDLIRKEVVIKFDMKAVPGEAPAEGAALEPEKPKVAPEEKVQQDFAALMERKQKVLDETKAKLREQGLSQEVPESEKSLEQRFQERYDRNGDGKVDEKERETAHSLLAVSLTMRDSQQNKESFMSRFDANGDGELSVEEQGALRDHYRAEAAKLMPPAPAQ